MFEIVEQFDLLILKDYNEEVNHYYALNAVHGQTYKTELTCKVDIKTEEVDSFVHAWDNLMDRFKIPIKHHNYIFYITQAFYSLIDLDNQYYYDVKEAVNFISFFIDYYKSGEIIRGKGKYQTMKEAIDNRIQLQLGIAHSNKPIVLNYSTTSSLVELLFKSIKSQDLILREVLHNYKSLPDKETLQEIKEQLDYKLSYPYQHYLIQTIKTLQKYISDHLSNELRKKTQLFLFELLYLFNIIQYSGKVNNIPSEDFKLDDITPERKFLPSKRYDDQFKIQFINSLIKKATKKVKYHSHL